MSGVHGHPESLYNGLESDFGLCVGPDLVLLKVRGGSWSLDGVSVTGYACLEEGSPALLRLVRYPEMIVVRGGLWRGERPPW